MNIVNRLRPVPIEPDSQWSHDAFETIVNHDAASEHRRHLRKYLAVGAVAAVVALGGVTAAAATGMFGIYDNQLPSANTVAAQERLDKLGDRIVAADTNGQIATTEVDQRSLTLIVHLKGPVPPKIAEIIKTADRDIAVKIEEARYSMTEMQAAIKRVGIAIGSGKASAYSLIAPNPVGSGLIVRVPKETYAKGVDSLISEYEAAAGVPVTVEIGEKIETGL